MSLEERVAALERRAEERERERQAQERRVFRAAIVFLGSVVVVLGGIVWSELLLPLIRRGQ